MLVSLEIASIFDKSTLYDSISMSMLSANAGSIVGVDVGVAGLCPATN